MPAPARTARPAARPNVLFIVSDDQHWADYGFMGHAHIRTPRIDRLAAESLLFPHGYVPSSLCRASLASMITGLFPHQHGITSNDPPVPRTFTGQNAKQSPEYLALRSRMVARFNRNPNLASVLGKAGFRSLQTGKWWEGDPCRCGFDESLTKGDPAKGGRHGDEGLKIGREGLKEAFDFIDRSKAAGKPFYLWYAPMMPHQPHNPPERFLSFYRTRTPSLHVARYWAMCEWFDETVGHMLDHLEQRGLAEDTLVIYLSDNGWIQNPEKPEYAERSKQSPYEGGIRTPILLRRPGHITPRIDTALVSSIDLAPTIYRHLGITVSRTLPGSSLLGTEPLHRRDAVFGEIYTHDAVDVDRPSANLRYRWIASGEWKLIQPAPQNSPGVPAELYHLLDDPYEKENLATQHPARVSQLQARLNRWWPGAL